MINEYYVGKSVETGEIVKGELCYRFGDGAPMIVRDTVKAEYVEVEPDSLDFITEFIGLSDGGGLIERKGV